MPALYRILAILILAVLLLAGPPAFAVEHSVTVSDHSFSPAHLTIAPGDSVRWSNSGPSAHNVRADDGSFTSGFPSSSWTYTRTFDVAGEVPYHCEPHGAPGGFGMAGRITVQGQLPPPVASLAINLGLTGSWFNPETNGQGFLFEVVPGFDPPLVALAWFTFERSAGGPETQRWFTAAGSYVDGDDAVELTVFRSTGGVIDSAQPPVSTVAIGTATLRFESCTRGSFEYSLQIDGPDAPPLARTIQIERITPADLCESLAEPGRR